MKLLLGRRIRRDLLAQLAISSDYDHKLANDMFSAYFTLPREQRESSRWVMNAHWFGECTKIAGQEPVTLIALPVTVTEDGGYPHLVTL